MFKKLLSLGIWWYHASDTQVTKRTHLHIYMRADKARHSGQDHGLGLHRVGGH